MKSKILPIRILFEMVPSLRDDLGEKMLQITKQQLTDKSEWIHEHGRASVEHIKYNKPRTHTFNADLLETYDQS